MSWMRSAGCQPSGIQPSSARPLGHDPLLGRQIVAAVLDWAAARRLDCGSKRSSGPPSRLMLGAWPRSSSSSVIAGCAAGLVDHATWRSLRWAPETPSSSSSTLTSSASASARTRLAGTSRLPCSHKTGDAGIEPHAPSDLTLLQALACAQVTHSRRKIERGRGQRDVAVFKVRDLVDHLSVTPQACRQGVGGDQQPFIGRASSGRSGRR